MKLLFLGSLVVLLGVVAWAAIEWAIDSVVAPHSLTEPIVPVVRFVNGARDGNRQPNAIIWQTSTAPNDCAEIVERRNRGEKERIADLMSSAPKWSLNDDDANACAPFQLGEVETGTKVEVLGECGQMASVRILSGRFQGQRGCIQTERLNEMPG